MFPYEKVNKMPYGGDYNPEQWTEDVWEEDMKLLPAAGIDTVTLNVFSWASLQPDETTYDFSTLDRIVDMVTDKKMNICMATATAVHPAWMARKYPDILRVDYEGRKRKFGGRHNSCPNSPTYRKYSVRLASKLAEHFAGQKNIIVWHVSNEYSGDCYCENCEKAFRGWLQERYGSLSAVNKAWNTAFWGHIFYDWDDIVLPDLRSEHFCGERTMFQGISLDYRRFMSDSILDCYKLERDAIRAVIPDAVITTNLMGFFKGLDYFKWAKEMDFVSWDNYPSNGDSHTRIAMAHDLMRGIKGGDPFCLMEQTPSVTNWQQYNALKRPGVLRLWSYQAVAHGSDTIMYFQMRRSIGACEKYHGAVIDHVGTGNTRVYREVSELGHELEKIGTQIMETRTSSDIALVMDWDNWWAVEYSAGPSCDLKYIEEFYRYYDALRGMNYNVDIISPDMDMSAYKVVIAPVMYMVKTGNDEIIRKYVRDGGIFVTTFFSGYVQENDLVITGGYPGKLRDTLGIWVEEEDALPSGAANNFTYKGKNYPASLICDLLHLEGAEQIDDGGYGEDFYAGMPVITKNSFGEGSAYYVATASNDQFYRTFLSDICADQGISPVMELPDKVEATSRERDGEKYIFVMNHNPHACDITIPWNCTDLLTGHNLSPGGMAIEKYDVKILKVEI